MTGLLYGWSVVGSPTMTGLLTGLLYRSPVIVRSQLRTNRGRWRPLETMALGRARTSLRSLQRSTTSSPRPSLVSGSSMPSMVNRVSPADRPRQQQGCHCLRLALAPAPPPRTTTTRPCRRLARRVLDSPCRRRATTTNPLPMALRALGPRPPSGPLRPAAMW